MISYLAEKQAMTFTGAAALLCALSLLLAPLLASAISGFSVTDDAFSTDGTTVKMQVIKNSDTGEEVAINVNFGGGVESLSLRSRRHGAVRSVLWTHDRNATAVALNADWRGKMLIPCAHAECSRLSDRLRTHCLLCVRDTSSWYTYWA